MKHLVAFDDCPTGPFIWGERLMLKTADGKAFRIADGKPIFPRGALVQQVCEDDVPIIPF